jgi:hypothetical protein
MMSKSEPKESAEPKDFLVAEMPGFPGVRIPLLSDEECKARGIEKPKLPPFHTWPPEKQEAGRKLAEALMDLAWPQALQLMLDEIERLPPDAKMIVSDIEPAAATSGIARIDSGKWKPGPKQTHGLDAYVRAILVLFVTGQVSLLTPPDAHAKAGTRKEKARKSRPRGSSSA